MDVDPALFAGVEPETARRLLLSAVTAFSAQGFQAATTREIGERAGLSPAAVYVYYASKHDLLFEISRVGHEASLAAVVEALEGASEDPAERVAAFVRAFARWHADNHVLARVIQYELKNLPPLQFRTIAASRARFQSLLRDEIAAGAARGVFRVDEPEETTLAVLSLCIDLARWYEPTAERPSAKIASLYARLALGMLGG